MRALASPAASILNPGASPNPRAPLRSAAAPLPRGPCPGRSVAAAAAAATGDHWGADHYHVCGRATSPEAGARAAHGVKCDVDVVSWRERRVLASVAVAADVDTLWQVITDYERLADFIPNLVQRSAFSRASRLSLSPVDCDSDCTMVMARLMVSDWRIFWGDFVRDCSVRIPCPHEGRIWLEQRGLQRALYWHIEARVVLDLQEVPDSVRALIWPACVVLHLALCRCAAAFVSDIFLSCTSYS